MYITLRCRLCGHITCPYARKYIPENSEEGCTRKVTEELAERFIHDTQEVLPFLPLRPRTQATDDAFARIEFDFEQIYQSPLGRLVDSKGKAKASKA